MYLVLGREKCGHCTQAINLLDSTNTPYVYKDITINPHYMDLIKLDLGMRTVPVVLELTGGYQELREKLKND